ncbi:MAG: hypothetical protein ACRDT0_19720 [Pseudonocardiaceae bacterium]
MPDFAVIQSALRVAASQADAAAQAIRPTALSGPVTQVAGALPGGAAQRAAQRLAVVWNADLSTWRDGMGRHAENMAASDGTYGAVDGGERDRFAGVG